MRYSFVAIILFFNVLLWQNCSNFEQSSVNEVGSSQLADGSAPIGDEDKFQKFQKIMQKNCNSCHGNPGTNYPSILDFTQLKTQSDWINHPKNLVSGNAPINSSVYNRLTLAKNINRPQTQNMPIYINTPKSEQMTQAEADFIADWINTIPEFKSSCDQKIVVPNKVRLRRLNKAEVKNSIKDILNVNHSFSSIADNDGGAFGIDGKFQATDQTFFNSYFGEIEAVADKYVGGANTKNCNNKSENQLTNCLAGYLKPIAELAYRKILTTDDISSYTNAMKKLQSAQQNFNKNDLLKAAIMNIFASPQFLFLLRNGDGSGVKFYNDFEIATRISLSLLQTLPSRELWNNAKNGRLSNISQLDLIIDEMVNDPRTKDRYSRSFLSGWLDHNKILDYRPNEEILKISQNNFAQLSQDMADESLLIFKDNLASNKPINSLVTGDTRFINQRLNNHYQLGLNIREADLKRVELPANSPYAGTGLLTSTLLVSTSMPERSSIVLRGQKVLNSFYCEDTPPPPEDAGEINFEDLGPNASQRDVSIAHRSDSQCASCHAQIDPFGLALGNFNALGQFQTKDQFGNSIDTSSEFAGQSFKNQKDMPRVLTKNSKFKSCFTEINLGYFTSQTVDTKNSINNFCAVSNIQRSLAGKSDNIASLLKNILTSDFFLKWNDSHRDED